MADYIEHYIEHCSSCGSYLGPDDHNCGECLDCYTPFSRVQRAFAVKNPDLYSSKVTLVSGDSPTLIERCEFLNLQDEILMFFGVFGVTHKGIECLNHDYFIETKHSTKDQWMSHMGEKNWVNMNDLSLALDYYYNTVK